MKGPVKMVVMSMFNYSTYYFPTDDEAESKPRVPDVSWSSHTHFILQPHPGRVLTCAVLKIARGWCEGNQWHEGMRGPTNTCSDRH